MSRPMLAVISVIFLTGSAFAEIDVGSDGSDGAFNPVANVTIDLALAATAAWNTPSPVPGQGVYDPDRWAVVFKYSSVNIPAGVTVTFANHPTHAPVIWLVRGSSLVAGVIDVGGRRGHNAVEARTHSEPGPGGFRGGRGSDIASLAAGGFGPGGAGTSAGPCGPTSSGSYASVGFQRNCGPPGELYGNAAVLPLIGGSGGAGGEGGEGPAVGGGAGGGALLIASDSSMTLTGSITANGGDSVSICGICAGEAGGGSGGAIRLVADQVSGSGVLRARPGSASGDGIAGIGRIRVEGNIVNLADPGDPSFVQDLPTFVFPPAGTPKLRATVLEDSQANTIPVPGDPRANITDNTMVDLTLGTSDPVTVHIEAENIPAGTCVDVRAVAKSGPTQTVKSSPLTAQKGGILTSTADLTFEPGFSVVQLRAVFGDGDTNCALLPAHLRGLKTLNGEQIVKLALGASLGRGSQTTYVTETGRRIPVGW